jgi:hypothetical protein
MSCDEVDIKAARVRALLLEAVYQRRGAVAACIGARSDLAVYLRDAVIVIAADALEVRIIVTGQKL